MGVKNSHKGSSECYEGVPLEPVLTDFRVGQLGCESGQLTSTTGHITSQLVWICLPTCLGVGLLFSKIKHVKVT